MTSRGVEFFFVEPKTKEITPAQRSWLSRYMNQFERALYGPGFADPEKGYAAYLDVESFIDQHWLIEMSKNIDGFRYSVFISKDRGGKLKMEPIWDWNLSFGNANYYDAWSPTSWYYPRLRETEISWYRRLVQDPEFQQRCVDRWGELRTNIFAPSRLLGRIDEMAALLQDAQARNFRHWQILGRRVNPNYYSGSTYQDEINYMKQWIQRRIAWIDGQQLSAPTLTGKEAHNGLALSAPRGQIYYTLDGSDPRSPGGAVSAKAQLYNGPILKKSARLFARAHHDNDWSAPVVSGSAGGQRAED
jgi:hypothetical protein